MSKFQIILTSIFIICIVAGVTLFATYKAKDAQNKLPAIEVWGTFPSSVFSQFIQKINTNLANPITINYIEIPKEGFEEKYIETLARGGGPDAVLLSQEEMAKYADKLIVIPTNLIPERYFKDTYISQAELYWTSQGTLAIPWITDPLLMYWNRDMFTNAGLATYPQYWDEFPKIIERINLKDQNSNIRRSALALGEFKNISHAREILSALFLQSGNPITTLTADGLQSTLGDGRFNGTKSSLPALNFFIQFANPRNSLYSWNRSLPSSKSSFLSGNLATYFGFASEIFDLRSKNPNIDFDVAPFPQARNGKNRVSYSSMYGFSISRSSLNQGGTFQVLSALTSPTALSALSELTYLPSVRRDVNVAGSSDPYMTIFLDSALISRGWLDLDTNKSNQIFTNLVESVTSGRKTAYNAIQDASLELDISLQNQ